jgi:23S rRNA (guanosine2251-2'-O)-methyltransferase
LRIYGRRPVLAALRRKVVRRLWVAPKAHGSSIKEVLRLAAEQDLDVQAFEPHRDSGASTEAHQGVMAGVIPPAPRHDFGDFVDQVLAEERHALLVVLDGVEDPQNLGAVLRTAECAGVDGVIVAGRRRAPFGAAVVKASAGAVLTVTVLEVGNLHQAVRLMKERGIWVVAASGEGEVSYSDFDWRRPVAVVMGAEGRGVSHVLKKAADERVRIPLLGEVESLNVSVATGIVLFECLRQRGRDAV